MDKRELYDHPFNALETLLSVHLELILYKKTCTRIETLLNSHKVSIFYSKNLSGKHILTAMRFPLCPSFLLPIFDIILMSMGS